MTIIFNKKISDIYDVNFHEPEKKDTTLYKMPYIEFSKEGGREYQYYFGRGDGDYYDAILAKIALSYMFVVLKNVDGEIDLEKLREKARQLALNTIDIVTIYNNSVKEEKLNDD